MLRSVLSLTLSIAMVLCSVPGVFAAGTAGQISGVAMVSSGGHFAGQIARLRSLDLGQVAEVTTTNGAGRFQFAGVKAGSYIVELVSNGTVVGTSVPVTLTAQSMTADGVTATAAVATAAQVSGGSYSSGSFWTSTYGIITMAAIAAGVTMAFVVTKDDASPSK